MLSRQGWRVGRQMGRLVAIVLCATGSVVAQEPVPAEPAAAPTAATPAAPARPQAATPASPSANSTPVKADAAQPAAPPATPAANPLTEGTLDADKIMAAQKAGYQIRNENGQTLLCRRDLQTGSRVRYRTSCLTAREWEQLREDNALVLKSIERRPRMGNQ